MRRRKGRAVSLSAQQIDPLSWFTGPHLPLVLAVVAGAWGATSTLLTWAGPYFGLWQIGAVAAVSGSMLVVHAATRPQQRSFDAVAACAAMTIAVLGQIMSAIGYADTDTLRLELWWAPFGVAMAFGSLGPYLPTRTLVAIGSGLVVVTTPASLLILSGTAGSWGPVSSTVLIAFPLLVGIVVTGIFSHHVVARMSELLDRRSQIVVSTDVVRDADAERAQRQRLAALTARAAPFLEQVIRAGGIAESDRTLAGQLARRVRDDLVTDSNRSWLESIAAETHIVVLDPDGLADRLRASQRTALRGLVRAILDSPGIDPGSLLVELRSRRDGATAVGVSLDVELPEGRRIMHLAPYLLTLKTAAEDLHWDDQEFLRVSFRFPPQSGA